MNLVDSCGWLEYLADAPNADFKDIDGVKYIKKR